MFNILMKTLIDALPMFGFIAFMYLFYRAIYLVGTADDSSSRITSNSVKLKRSWDVVRPTRFMSLE